MFKLQLDRDSWHTRSKFRNNLKNLGISKNGTENVWVAVSGGKDSVALLLLFLDFFGEYQQDKVKIVHINHGLRDPDSLREQEFVESLGQMFGLEFKTFRLDPPSIFPQGIECWGREQRYNVFKALDGYVATAHTIEDNTESMIMAFLKGYRDPFNGISEKWDMIIRPILNIYKEEIYHLLDKEHIKYIEDSSNNSMQFLRNRVRKILLPMIQTVVNPGIHKSMLRNRRCGLYGSNKIY